MSILFAGRDEPEARGTTGGVRGTMGNKGWEK